MLIHLYANDTYHGSIFQEKAKPNYPAIFARYPSVNSVWAYADNGHGVALDVKRRSISKEAIRKAAGNLFECMKDAPRGINPPVEYSDFKTACAMAEQVNRRTVALENKKRGAV